MSKMLDKALSIAKEIPYERGKQRVAAIVTDKRGRILAARTNCYTKTHPLQKEYAVMSGNPHRQCLHAELATIIAGQRIGKIHSIYVARSSKAGYHLPSKPCPVCQIAIREAGIENVYYVGDE